jgi:hypothetical protein
MRFAKVLTFVSLAVLLTATVAAASPNLVVNGGFETGDFTGWAINGVNCCTSITTSFANYGPHGGSYFFEQGNIVSSYDDLSQLVATAPGNYTLSFWINPDLFDDNNGRDTFVNWGGATIADFNAGNAPANGWQLFSTTVSATGPTSLEFIGYNNPSYTGIDDVSVTATTAPEPSTLLLLGGALSIVGLRFRKSKSR